MLFVIDSVNIDIYISITSSKSTIYDIFEVVKQCFNDINDKLDGNQPETVQNIKLSIL